jgi:Flp pilus assembly protein TadG
MGEYRRSGWRAFRRNKDGSTAVELALIAAPLFFLMFGIAEFAVMGIMQTNLDHAVAQASRKVRTGQATGGISETQLKKSICDDLNVMMSVQCDGNLYLDVDKFTNFGGVDTGSPVKNGAMDGAQMNYTPGVGGDVILVRAYFTWKLFTPFFSKWFANVGSDKHLIVSAMMFRNEPF